MRFAKRMFGMVAILAALLSGGSAYAYVSAVCGSGVSVIQFRCCNIALSEEGGDSTVAFYPIPCGDGGIGRGQSSCSRWTNFMESAPDASNTWQTIRPHPLGCSYSDQVQALQGW